MNDSFWCAHLLPICCKMLFHTCHMNGLSLFHELFFCASPNLSSDYIWSHRIHIRWTCHWHGLGYDVLLIFLESGSFSYILYNQQDVSSFCESLGQLLMEQHNHIVYTRVHNIVTVFGCDQICVVKVLLRFDSQLHNINTHILKLLVGLFWSIECCVILEPNLSNIPWNKIDTCVYVFVEHEQKAQRHF